MHIPFVELLKIHQCLSDETRLRILHLLARGPLCVSHFQEILDLPQVKISQHLAYLRKRGVVKTTRHANWMIYSLPEKPSRELEVNLQCLRERSDEEKRLRNDLKKLKKVRLNHGWVSIVLQGVRK